jgi:hypothetical protein
MTDKVSFFEWGVLIGLFLIWYALATVGGTLNKILRILRAQAEQAPRDAADGERGASSERQAIRAAIHEIADHLKFGRPL